MTALDRIRRICLSFPEAHEVEAWGEATFRVRNKLFAMFASHNSHHGGGRPGIWIKSTFVNQDLMLHSDSARFFSPPYVGPSGWIGIFLDNSPDWDIVSEVLRDGYLLTAPKKIAAQLHTPAPPAKPVKRPAKKTAPRTKAPAKKAKSRTESTPKNKPKKTRKG
jgi:predicted DNA-binding protein (MmcQ/YjbR family)